jgi:hypothetical protein
VCLGREVRYNEGVASAFSTFASCVETRPIGCMKWTGEHGDTTFDDWITLQRKKTYARQLAGETNALLLTLDVWHLKLFGHDVGHEPA